MMASEEVELERFRRMGKAAGTLYQAAIEAGAPEALAVECVRAAGTMGFFNDYGGQVHRDWKERQDAAAAVQSEAVAILREVATQLKALVASQQDGGQ